MAYGVSHAQLRRFHTPSKQLRRAWRHQRLSRRAMVVESLERRDLLAADVIFNMPSTGVYDLSVEGGELNVHDSTGNVLLRQAMSEVATLTVHGTSGDDTLRILESVEGLPQLSGDLGFQLASFLDSGFTNSDDNQNIGLHFEAGAGDDTLELITANSHTVSYFAGEANLLDVTQKRGNVNVADQLTLSFAGLTPQVVPGGGGTLRVDASSDPSITTLTVRDDTTDLAGSGGMMVAGDGGFETVFFSGFDELIVIGGDGPETMELFSFDPATSLTAVTLDGDSNAGTDVSTDTLIVTSLPTNVSASLLGGGGDDVFSIDQTAGFVALGPISIDGGDQDIGDSLQFTGDGVESATIFPDSAASDAATVDYGANPIGFQNVEISLIGGLNDATYITPNQVDDLVVQEISAGGTPVLTFSGTSDGIFLSTPVFASIPTITIDTGTNDGAEGADNILYDNLETPAGLIQMNLVTGAFEDNITLAAVATDTEVIVDAGSENDFVQIGTVDFGLNDILGGVNVVGGDQDVSPEWNDSVAAAGVIHEVTNVVGDTLRLVDLPTTFDRDYVIQDSTIEVVGIPAVNYSQTETLELVTGEGNNQIDVHGTPAGSTLRIQAGNLAETVNISNTGTGSIVDISTFNGDDQFGILLTGLGSLVRIDSEAGVDQMLIQDLGPESGISAAFGDDADTVVVEQVAVTAVVTIQGDNGADAISVGLADGSANIQLDGGSNNDVLEIAPETLGGNSLLIGGDDADTLRVRETASSSDEYVLDGNSITKTVLGDDFSANHETVEVIELFTGEGADEITVTPAAGIQFEIDGGAPTGELGTEPGDRLIPVTDGLANVNIPTDVTSGVITADGVGDIVFTDIELLPEGQQPPPTDDDGDRFEPNETIETATTLGSEPVVTLREVNLHEADDADVYRITAHDSGKMIVDLTDLGGEIVFEILDVNGTQLAVGDSITNDTVFPVVSQEDYYIQVSAPTNQTNGYALEIENFPAPVPTGVELDPASDTGASNSDGVTSDTTPRLLVQADLRDFANMGITILDTAAATSGEAGAGVIVRLTDPETGVTQSAFADPIGASSQFWEFVPPADLPDGVYLVAASVIVIDGQRPAPAADDTELSPSSRFTIDTSLPASSVPQLAPGFDTGMDSSDNVTASNQPLLFGAADPFSAVTVFAQNIDAGLNIPVGNTIANNNGTWQVATSPLPDGAYRFSASATNLAGLTFNSGTSTVVTIDTVDPNAARIVLLSDDGQSTNDQITSIHRPTVSLTAGDVDGPTAPHDVKYRLYLLPDGSATETLLIDSFAAVGDFVVGGSFTHTLSLALNSPGGDPLPDGTHDLRLEVEDRAGNVTQAETFKITIDTVPPEKSFGDPMVLNDGLLVDSDSGISGDRITNDRTPTFWGFAESETRLEAFVVTDAGQVSLGETLAIANRWELTSFVDLTDPSLGFDEDDVQRNIVLRGEDVAGNVTADMTLEVFIDVVGPRITSVRYPNNLGVFDPKPTDGPSPLSDQLLVTFVDQIPFHGEFTPSNTVRDLVLDPGNYALIGDATGHALIESVEEVLTILDDSESRLVATTVAMNLVGNLPDDRLSLTILDRITDVAGNPLDGDARSSEPGTTTMLLPSGDGAPGGDFMARFTVDARPEIGTWGAGSVYVDTNGNFTFDPENRDDTNEDIVYTLGFASDDIFAGNFVAAANGVADGFDKLAAYGDVGVSFDDVQFRWLIDVDNDGVVEVADGDIQLVDGENVNGLPVAGRFDSNDVNGDEVGVFTGRVWWMDTDHDFQLDTHLNTRLRGYPIVGDFDGDGFDDLGTYNEAEDRFEFDLSAGHRNGWDGALDAAFHFGFAGIRERPVAADFDGDQIDDVGLWVPDRAGQTPDAAGEWYLLVSGGAPVLDRAVVDPQSAIDTVRFTPQPFGDDLYAQFGDEFAMPIVGNFDPPVTDLPSESRPRHNAPRPFDVNDDGVISPVDALIVINYLDGVFPDDTDIVFVDTNQDGNVSPVDALGVINTLNEPQVFTAEKAPVWMPVVAEDSSDSSGSRTTLVDVILSDDIIDNGSEMLSMPAGQPPDGTATVSPSDQDDATDELWEMLAIDLLEALR